MREPCLHCAIWRTIRDHATARRSALEGVAICDRWTTIDVLGIVLAEALYSEPDPMRRRELAERVCTELREVAAMPGSAQPRNDMEVVSWQ